MIYATMLVDYGFNTTSVRQISVNRNNSELLSKIFITTIFTKFLFCIILFFLFYLLSISLKLEHDVISFFTLSSLYLIGNTALPTWFFQGIEKIKIILILNVLSKILFLALVLWFIHKPNDYKYVLFFWGIGALIASFIGYMIIFFTSNIRYKPIGLNYVLKNLKDGYPIFISNIAVLGITQSNIIILSFLSTNLMVGYFSIAEKIISAIWQILTSYSQVLYPRLCQVVHLESDIQVGFFLKKTFWLFFFLVLLICIGTYLFAAQILYLLFHNRDVTSIIALQYMSIIPVLVCSNIPANITLLALNKQKTFSNIFIFSSLQHITISFVFTYNFGLNGAILASIITLALLSIILHYNVIKINSNLSILNYK